MFLKAFYRFNKPGFFIFLLFIFLFIVLNVKHGMVATPVYQFGMYSAPMKMTDTQVVFQVFLNGVLLNQSEYAFAHRDILQTSLSRFERSAENNAQVFQTLKMFFAKAGAAKLMKESVFTNETGKEAFSTWYSNKIGEITGRGAGKLDVYRQTYLWNGNLLQTAGSPQKLLSVASY